MREKRRRIPQHSGVWRRMLSVMLAFAMVVTLGGFDGITVKAAVSETTVATVTVGETVTEYTNLKNAFDAGYGQSDATVTLYKDVSGFSYALPEHGSLVLDMNQHTISHSDTIFTSRKSGSDVSLTIKNGTITTGGMAWQDKQINGTKVLVLDNVVVEGTQDSGNYLIWMNSTSVT